MTKRFLAIPLLLSTTQVAAYVEDSMSRKFVTSGLPKPWSKAFRTKIEPLGEKQSVSRKTRVVPISTNESIDTTLAFDVEEIIRDEYNSWAKRYGKTKLDKRFEIFRHNFIAQMEFNRETGQFFLLNEYGDMTTEEYEQLLSSQSSSSFTPDTVSVAPMGSTVGISKKKTFYN